MPFDITITRDFSASHQLRLYDGSLEPLHGHNWRVVVTVSAEKLDSIGVVMDFHQLQHLLDEITGPMHNRHLNDLSAFASRNPSAEHVALHIAQSLRLPRHIILQSVEVWETCDCRARWRRDGNERAE
jgi:6-pyruvoyltetrahydropterin/6-carboxytetrahydropterin synthase